jgi:carboxyl-terminal processing protease
MKDGKIVYLAISQFKTDTVNELDGQVNRILSEEPRGIVLDLRNNPGGYLEIAIEIASRFIEAGKVVVVEDYGDTKNVHKTAGNSRFNGIPVVVLINEGSASASEILAGALKDNIGAKLVGKKTFGKGLVQELEYLKDGSAVKITVAKWLTPNGVNINKEGIKPDYEVEMTLDDYENDRDPQLEKAIKLLK